MNTTYGTITGTGYAITLPATEGDRPKESPKGLIATQAVETRAGWLGQVFVDKKIVFESETAHEDSADAIAEANERVVSAVSALF